MQVLFKNMKKVPSMRIWVQMVQPSAPKPQFRPGVWLGVALAVSESLPFVDNKYNGIIHALKEALN